MTSHADFVVTTEGTFEETDTQIDRIVQIVKSLNP
jgi:hypothetical protein